MTSLAPRWLTHGLVAVLLSVAHRAAAADETLWELTPYRVHVLVGLTPEAGQCGNLATDVTTGLAARVWCVVGARWTLTAGAAPLPLGESLVYDFDRLQAEQILPALGEEQYDKVFLVRLAFHDGVYSVTVRDFDVRTQLVSAAVDDRVYHRARLADATLQAMLAAFAPLARVEDVSGDKVTMRLRGADVPTRDPTLATVADNSIFRPVIRSGGRPGKPPRIQPIDWTYLVADGREGSRVTARMVTGLRSPLVNRRHGRVEQLALFVHLPSGDTTLELRATDKGAHPLVGYQIYSHPLDSKETKLLGATDTRGALVIPPGDGGVRVLLVKCGTMVMARLPLLPGLAPVAIAQVPDDQRRLQVEGLITGFQEELVDLIARRQVLMARIRARIKAGKPDEAKALLSELRRLRSHQDITRALLVERQRRTSDDPRTQRQIDKLFDDTQTVINRFLDARAIDRLERELGGDETAQAKPPAQDGS
jgi:hypothetical protein